jgi:hypothetical protein
LNCNHFYKTVGCVMMVITILFSLFCGHDICHNCMMLKTTKTILDIINIQTYSSWMNVYVIILALSYTIITQVKYK